MTVTTTAAFLLTTAVVAFGLSLLARRWVRGIDIDPGPWSSTLSYVATAYGIVLGFSIIFLFGEFSAARAAIGDEATSIGTAFDEAQLFPASQDAIQHSLICYSRAVPAHDWPALQVGRASPEVDAAYSDLFVTLSESTEPTSGTFQPATATNLLAQLGNISTARETRLVAAEIQTPPLLWVLLIFGGVLILVLLFVVTLQARAAAQAALVSVSAVFTVVMLLIVVALSTPFSPGAGRLSPALIEQTTESMETTAPDLAALPCDVETDT
ncbi:bestrophin-like domain [Isoptericola aurantiacus]|uniref:bestrophin-like domain n=1 Tax=Isoptericola aurantiacus TaxID=3377839 RepID=UPI00383BEAC0